MTAAGCARHPHKLLYRAFTAKRQRPRVVITGLGAITPIGSNISSTWEAVLKPRVDTIGITSLQDALALQNLTDEQYTKEWELLQRLPCQVAASVDSSWIKDHPSAQHLQINDGRTSRFVQLALIAAHEAIVNSGLEEWLDIHLSSEDTHSHDAATYQARRESMGVSIGNGMSSTRDISMARATLSDAGDPSKAHRKLSPHFVPRILPNSPSARVAIHNQLLGPNISHSEACAAGACAIAHGVELIQSGRVNGMLVGGCESAVDPLGLIGFSRLRALSSGTLQDGGVFSCSRPFDSARDGFVLSEGAAILVLEEHSHAVSRGANILAEVVGVGYSGDGFHITAPEPEGHGAARAMLKAASDASIDLHDLDYINAHATSTPVGDVAEIRAIQLAMSESQCSSENTTKSLFVSSTKGATGHLLGASGAIEAALTVLAVQNGNIPHTHNLDNICGDILDIMSQCRGRHFHLIQHTPVRKDVKFAMSNSFGFGGTNASLLFAKYDE